ncbi:hypothetical protein, partial [Vibrio parahaemolyticus]
KKTKQTHINQSFSMEEVAAHLNLLANSLGMYSMLFLLWSHNAALRREQRNTQRLPHCALNTKFTAN